MAYGHTISDAIRFGFSVGRVRVLEGRLLTNAALERLLDAASFEEQRRILADTEYGSYLESARTAGDVEAALDTYLESLYVFMETARLPAEVTRYFRVRHDYANLKSRFKAEARGMPLAGLLVPNGTVAMEHFTGPLEMLPAFLRDLDPLVRDDDDEVISARIDPIVDRALFADMLEAARVLGCQLLYGIAELAADLANVKTVLRAHRLGWPAAQTRATLVEGGVSPDALMLHYGLSFPEMAERLAVAARLQGVEPEDLLGIERLDVLADNLLMRRAKKARLIATGIEPVIGYVMARQSEMVILRTLLLGKLAGLSAEALRVRTRELYV